MKRMLYIMVSVLAWAGLVLTGCTNIDPDVAEIEKGKQYTLCIKAKKGKPETKTLTFVNGELRSYWAKGDVLKVYDATTGEHIVDLESQAEGKETEFKVTLTEAQAGQLTAATQLKLEYKGPGYDAQDGTLESLSDNCDYSVAYVSVNGVDNNEYTITTDKADFTSQQAIVQFKVEDENANIVSISKLEVDYGFGQFTVNVASSILNSNDEKDYRYFVAIPESEYVKLTATGTDGRVYTYEKGDNIYVKAVDYVLQNGYYYPIAVRMHGQPMLGDPYYSDGTWATCNKHADGAKAVGIVVYLGSGAIVENYPHGLVMALKDATTSEVNWATEAIELFKDEWVTLTEHSLANCGGLAKTAALCTEDRIAKYPAAAAAYKYAAPVNKEKCSGWFLPSSGQWLSVVYGICGAEYPVKADNTWWKNGLDYLWGEGKGDGNTSLTDIAKVLFPSDDDGYAHSLLNAAMQAVSKDYDSIITKNKGNYVSYWTSSVNSKSDAIRMNFGVEENRKNGRYSSVKTDNKPKKSEKVKYRVRAFLAF